MKIRYAIMLFAFLSAVLPSVAAAEGTPRETLSYTVETGETLSAIAGMHGMSVKEIKKLNHIRKPRKLRAGARILVYKPASPIAEDAETAPKAAADVPAPPPAAARESRIARELKVLTDTPVVNGLRDLSGPSPGGNGIGGIKDKLIRIAHAMLDIPYRFGGSSVFGIDCSAYVQKVFGLLDIVLPRTAREQFNLGKLVGKDELSIGDLVFFRTYAKFPSHVGIYLGDNRFIHASSTDRKVTIDSLDAPYYIKRFVGARRLPLDEPADEI